MKILFLYSHGGEIVTGGEKYEDILYRDLSEQPRFSVERRWLNNFKGKTGKYLSVFRNLAQARGLRQYDLVIFNSAHCFNFILLMPLLKLLGVNTMVIHHHFLFHGMSGARRVYYRWLEKCFLGAARHLAVPSPYMADICGKMFPRREIIYWQIPFEPNPVTGEMRPQPGNLLYIGTIEPRKGLDLLLDAMSLLKERGVDCRLTAVGKNNKAAYRGILDRKIADNKLDVRFTGYISDKELARVISQADLFTFPSRLEGYGMVICESMVNGLPVICFDNSAMPYTVKDGVNGLLVPDGDIPALANAIAHVTADRKLRDHLSRGALDTVATFMTPRGFKERVCHDVDRLISGKDA